MTKRINIQEGGTDNDLAGIAKIKTKLKDGGTCNWVPEDETKQIDLTVTQNGTYEAAGSRVHSFRKVTVRVSGEADSVTGKIDGKKYRVTKNAQGKLVYTEVSDD